MLRKSLWFVSLASLTLASSAAMAVQAGDDFGSVLGANQALADAMKSKTLASTSSAVRELEEDIRDYVQDHCDFVSDKYPAGHRTVEIPRISSRGFWFNSVLDTSSGGNVLSGANAAGRYALSGTINWNNLDRIELRPKSVTKSTPQVAFVMKERVAFHWSFSTTVPTSLPKIGYGFSDDCGLVETVVDAAYVVVGRLMTDFNGLGTQPAPKPTWLFECEDEIEECVVTLPFESAAEARRFTKLLSSLIKAYGYSVPVREVQSLPEHD
jgi:hypothetical protein